MREIIYPNKNTEPISLALGFFDCLHIGHKAVLDTAKQMASDNVLTAVATFLGNPSSSRLIYTYDERKVKLGKLGVDLVLGINFDDEFSSLTPDEFLESIISSYNIKTITCGFDYRYGANRAGNSDTLKAKCKAHNIPVTVVDEVAVDSKKVSSSLIKSLLSEGAIESANALLVSNYTVCGLVMKGNARGTQIGVPTANIILPKDKHPIKAGVYGAYVHIDNKRYKAVTNAGTAPTFGQDHYIIETHIIGFEKDIYGKSLTVELVKRLRDIKKFDSVSELVKQIKTDCKW
ncbi:MAG: bifunctional riboflavin kinase/FAD synthetase [Firmicutes bacterium]|nr:bifunctional riboflavin kinase/FAD synthetase [Bacillota bacterium]